jgi:hypothetical protein
MKVVLAEQQGIGTVDHVEHRGAVYDDVPAVSVDIPFDLENGDYDVRAIFGEHGEFGVQVDETVIWIPVPAGVLERAEEIGLLAVVTEEMPDGTLAYFVIHWDRPEDADTR